MNKISRHIHISLHNSFKHFFCNSELETLDYIWVTLDKQQCEKALKREKYPETALLYVIDYSKNKRQIYRIGITSNLTKRKYIYDTHTLYKHDVVLFREYDCPTQLEKCLQAVLYPKRIKDHKDFYECSLDFIKKAIESCEVTLNSCKDDTEQTGGNSESLIEREIYTLKNVKTRFVRLSNSIARDLGLNNTRR